MTKVTLEKCTNSFVSPKVKLLYSVIKMSSVTYISNNILFIKNEKGQNFCSKTGIYCVLHFIDIVHIFKIPAD